MADAPHVKEGDQASASHYNNVIDMARTAANLLPSSTISGLVGGASGTTLTGSTKTLVRIFELTEDITYPDDQSPPTGWATLPDVPYAENCKAIWLDPDANAYSIVGSESQDVYFPTDVDSGPGDDPAITAGDRVRAVWDAQAGRWHADVPTTAEVPEDPTATVILCLVNQATVSANGDAFNVDTVTVVSPFGGSTPTVTSVVNLLHFPSVEDNRCVAFLQSGTWYGVPQPPMATAEVVTNNTYVSASNWLAQKKRDVTVFAAGSESSYVPWLTGQDVTVVTSVSKDGTALKYGHGTIVSLEALASASTTTWETLTTLDPVTEIDYIAATSHTFNLKKTRDMHMFSVDGSGGTWTEDPDWTTEADQVWHSTTEESVVVSVDKSSLLLRYQTENTHALEAFDTSANSTWHTLVLVDPVTDIQYDSSPSPGTFDYKLTQNVEVFAKDAEDAAWSAWHTMVLVTDVVTDIRLDGFDLDMYRETANMVEDLHSGSWELWHTASGC